MELEHWQQDLFPKVAAAGYAGLWNDPPGRRSAFTVGCAVLWRPSRGVHLTWSDSQPRALVCEFELSPTSSVAVAPDTCTTSSSDENGIAESTPIMAAAASTALQASAEAAGGKCKDLPGGDSTQRLAVACVHLEGRRGAGRARIEQLRGALRSVEHRAATVAATTRATLSATASDASTASGASSAPPSKSSQSRRSRTGGRRRRSSSSSGSSGSSSAMKPRLPPCIVCGDFNSGPKSPPVQLLKLGRLPSGKVSDRGFNLKVGLR